MNPDFKEFFKSLNARGVEFSTLILGRPPNRIDVLTKPDGISWDTCWNRRVQSDYAAEPIAYLSLEDLVQNKLAAGRDQDLVDAKKLRLIAEKLRAKEPRS